MEHSEQKAILPPTLLTRQDLRHVEREISAFSEIMHQMAIRQKQGVGTEVPRVSPLLESVATANNISLDKIESAEQLEKLIAGMLVQATTFNFSFASSPSAAFLEKLVRWLREEITPLAVVQIGLRPALAAGCVLRVNSRTFDFSLGRRLNDQKSKLQEVLFS